MKLECRPQEKHLVLYAHVRIIEGFKNKWINEAKNNINHRNGFQEQVQFSNNFQNILW